MGVPFLNGLAFYESWTDLRRLFEGLDQTLSALRPKEQVFPGTQAPVEPAVQDTTEADVAAITAMMQQYDSATNSGDVATLLAMSTADSVRMGPNRPVEAGIEAIRAGSQEFFNQNTAQLTTVIEDIEVSGDLAFARTSYKQTTTLKESGETSEEVGKWILVYKRQADGWKIYTEAWSSDSPPPEG